MLLRIVEDTRTLLSIETTHPALQSFATAPFSQRIPARGEQVVLTDASTGLHSIYHILQVQHAFGVEATTGAITLLGIDVQVRLVTQQSGFNPLTSGAP